MPAPKDLTGLKTGRCIVIKRHIIKNDPRKCPTKEWLLKCDCGELFVRRQADITGGYVFECPNCVFRKTQFYLGGKKFGRLHVQDKWEVRESENGRKDRFWWCKCECGNEKWVTASSITLNRTTSCGCYARKIVSRYANETLYPFKHGKCHDPMYQSWISLIHKCYNPKNQAYHIYGHEGYTVCDIWKNSFEEFYNWMVKQKWEKGLIIHTKDNKKEFKPHNCFLISNRKLYDINQRKARLRNLGITYNNKTLLLNEWSKELGINHKLLYTRLKKGLTFEKAIKKKYNQGSGEGFKRKDISDDIIKEMYESGMTIKEINEATNSNVATYRLKKMKIKGRLPIQRNAINTHKIIKEMAAKKATAEEILEKVPYRNKYSLKYRMLVMGFKFNGMKILYD